MRRLEPRPTAWRRPAGRVAAGLALLAATACSSGGGGTEVAEPSEPAPSSTAFRPDVERTTSTDDPGSALGGLVPDDATTPSTGSDISAATSADLVPDVVATDGEPDPWSSSATAYRGQDGLLVAYDCSPGGTPRSVWGSGPYTDDSSVCTAAVHAGRISIAEGGRVVVRIGPGLDEYPASSANGVEAGSWGAWDGSFDVVDAPAG